MEIENKSYARWSLWWRRGRKLQFPAGKKRMKRERVPYFRYGLYPLFFNFSFFVALPFITYAHVTRVEMSETTREEEAVVAVHFFFLVM
jgi:hypothetical protein